MKGFKNIVMVLLVAVSIYVTVAAFPKKKSEDEIREYLTKKEVLETLTKTTRTGSQITSRIFVVEDVVKDADSLFRSKSWNDLYIFPEDWEYLDLSVDEIYDTEYSVYGDCYCYRISLHMAGANITDRFCDISLSGDVHTYYDGGGGKHASFSLDKSSGYFMIPG